MKNRSSTDHKRYKKEDEEDEEPLDFAAAAARQSLVSVCVRETTQFYS